MDLVTIEHVEYQALRGFCSGPGLDPLVCGYHGRLGSVSSSMRRYDAIASSMRSPVGGEVLVGEHGFDTLMI